MTQLAALAQPFPPKFVSQKPGAFSASYVSHDVVTQRLLEIVGPFSFSLDELIRDKAGDVVGCLATLIVTIDDRTVSITEVGDVEPAGAGKKNDGARAKDALSDAFKRCAMRLGVGLHLWAGDNYYLHTALRKVAGDPQSSTPVPAVGRATEDAPDKDGEVLVPVAADPPLSLAKDRADLADRIRLAKMANMPVATFWKQAKLPKVADCSADQVREAHALLDRMEQEPF